MRTVKPKVDEHMLGGDGPMKPAKSKPRYPTFRLPLEVIPEAAKWDVVKEGEDKGATYTIELEVRTIGVSNARYDKNAEFEIRKIGTETAEEEKAEGEGEQ